MKPEDDLQLAKRFVELPVQERQAFLDELRQAGIDFDRFPIPGGIDADDRNELSSAQRRIWPLCQTDSGNAACNLSCAFRLVGRLNVPALHRAFDSVIARHEMLRMAVRCELGIGPRLTPAMRASRVAHTYLTALPRTQGEQCVRGLAEHHALQPFDLEAGPLWRVSLLKFENDERVLLLCLHRLVADERSLQVFVDDLMHYYRAYEYGEEPTLADLPIQYRDYAMWQRRWIEVGDAMRQLAYWQSALGNTHPILEIPGDRPRLAAVRFHCARHRFTIRPKLAEDLRALVQRQRRTLSVVLLGTLDILLHCWTCQADIRIGVPIANRYRPETRSLIGCIADMLVIRARVDVGMRVDKFLSILEEMSVAAQTHVDLPSVLLLETLPQRLNQSPLCQVTYSHNAQVVDIGARQFGKEVILDPLDMQSGSSQFDLSLDTYEEGGYIHAVLSYATDLFDAATIERLAEHWGRLLGGIVADPTQRISDLQITSEKNVRQRFAVGHGM